MVAVADSYESPANTSQQFFVKYAVMSKSAVHCSLNAVDLAGACCKSSQSLCLLCRGVQQNGLSGLPFGLLKGSLGLVGHPLGSLLGTAASLSGSIRNSLLGVAMLPPRLRPPRHVSSRQPLSLYSYIDVSIKPSLKLLLLTETLSGH